MYADYTTLFSNLKSFGNNIQTKEYLINAELSNVIIIKCTFASQTCSNSRHLRLCHSHIYKVHLGKTIAS